MRNNFTLFFIFWSSVFFGQSIASKMLQGRIMVESNYVDGVNIKNETTNQTTVSRIEGYFRLPAKEGDIVVFSSVNLELFTKIVTQKDLINNELKIEMLLKSIILKSVIINDNAEISAEKLRIIPYGQKKYTPAERKLYTATSGGGIDGILNTISGRKQMLKKEILVEKKEQFLQKLEYLFEEKFYTQQLKIPKDYIKGFQYYCIENQDFSSALKAKNKTLCEFQIIKLAELYNQIIADESK